MFVADSSVWIDYFLAREGREVALLDQALAEDSDVYLCGPILQEVLQGIRREDESHRQMRNLMSFSVLETTRWTFIRAASLYRFLRARGVTVNSFDTAIAAVCLENRLPLLTCNRRDFEPLARYAGLRLA